MKTRLLFAASLLLAFTAAKAQISSSNCLDDLRKVYAQIDNERFLAGTDQMRLDFKHSYIMRMDEEQKTVTYEESLIIGPKFVYYDTPEFTDCSDATEAFSYRKYQFLIYRTKSNLSKTSSLIPEMDKGVFGFCLVKECGFIPAPGSDTLRHKRALMTLNEEGQKMYLVKELEFVWNPVTGQPLIVAASFTDKNIWKWARWDLHSIAKMETPIPGDMKGNLMDGSGAVQVRFKGSEVLDYR